MIKEGREALCINCGHCVSVCPNGALSLASMPVYKCEPLRPGWRSVPEAVEQLLKGRRSIRVYKDTPVRRDIIDQLIYIARYAPSGINRQPVRWVVINDKEKVRQLAKLTIKWMHSHIKEGSKMASMLKFENMTKAWEKGNDRVLRGAPAVVVAYGLKGDMMAPQAATIALTYLEIAALPFGLGTCWAGYLHMAINESKELHDFLGLSGRAVALGALMIGYPKFEYVRIPARNKPHIKH